MEHSSDGYESDTDGDSTDDPSQRWVPVHEAPDLIDFASPASTTTITTASTTFTAGDSPTDNDSEEDTESSVSDSEEDDEEESVFEEHYGTDSEPPVADLISF